MAHDGHPHHNHHHHPHDHPGVGHNGPREARQWQTPHLPPGAAAPVAAVGEPDLDLVETAFAEAFPTVPDPTSFLRLAGVPFTGRGRDGVVLSLLRVELQQTTDVGTLTPHLGGASFRHDPLPASMTSQRKTLAFIYFDGGGVVRLSLGEAKALTTLTEPPAA